MSTRFGGKEIAADAGWDVCALPARPKCKESTVPDAQKPEQKKKLARRIRRRTKRRRRVEQRERHARLEEAKARSRNSELEVATYDVRTLSLTGKHGAGHAEVVLRKSQAVGCDVIGLRETRRPRRTESVSYTHLTLPTICSV